jgi:hypothetical protein
MGKGLDGKADIMKGVENWEREKGRDRRQEKMLTRRCLLSGSRYRRRMVNVPLPMSCRTEVVQLIQDSLSICFMTMSGLGGPGQLDPRGSANPLKRVRNERDETRTRRV